MEEVFCLFKNVNLYSGIKIEQEFSNIELNDRMTADIPRTSLSWKLFLKF